MLKHKFNPYRRFSKTPAIIFVVLFAGVGVAVIFFSFAAGPGSMVNQVLTNPATTGTLEPSGIGGGGNIQIAENGSVSALLYYDASTSNQWFRFTNSTTQATSDVSLSTGAQTQSINDYIISSTNDIWTIGDLGYTHGSPKTAQVGPVYVNEYQLSGSPLPTSMSLISSQTFGDANSQADTLIQLASGAIAVAWHESVSIYNLASFSDPGYQYVSYFNVANSTWTTTTAAFEPTNVSIFRIAQQPNDGSVWVFEEEDTDHRIGAERLTEGASGLTVNWTDKTYITDGEYGDDGPADEFPNLQAIADPTTETIDLSYQDGHSEIFSTTPGNFNEDTYITIAQVATDKSLSFIELPQWSADISPVGLVTRGNELWLMYQGFNPTSLSCSTDYVDEYVNGAWDSPTALGQVPNVTPCNDGPIFPLACVSIVCEATDPTAWGGNNTIPPQFALSLTDSSLHLFTFPSDVPPAQIDTPSVGFNAPLLGSDVSGVVNVNINATDSSGISKVVFSEDGNVVSTDTSAPYNFVWDATSDVDGDAGLTATAYNMAGTSNSKTIYVVIANESVVPPTTPTNLIVSSVTPTSAKLNWTASTDSLGIYGYSLISYSTGAIQASYGVSPTYTLTSLTPGTTYIYQVQAFDQVGNISTSSAPVTFTTPPSSSSSPTVTIISPPSGSPIYGKGIISINTTDTPNDGGSIASVELLVDSSPVQTLTSAPYNFSFNSLPYTEGNQTIAIQATDNQGDVGTATIPVIITNGDLNGDGKVNIYDLAILAQNWGKTGMAYAQGNITGQSTVNISDLSIIAAEWGWAESN